MTNDPYGLISSGLPPEVAARARGLTREQAVAEAMLAQSQTPLDGTRMAGGYVVPISPWEGLAKLGKAYFGRKALDSADERSVQLGNEYQNITANEVARYMAKKSGVPGSSETIVDEQANGGEGAPATINAPAVAANPRAAVMEAMTSRNPMLQKLGQADYKQLQPTVLGRSMVIPATGQTVATDSTWQAEQEAARVARKQDLETKLADARTSREEAAAMRRELAQMADATRRDLAGQADATRRDMAAERASQGGKPPPGYRFTPEGNMEAIPGGPADLKAQAELQKKANGAGDVDVSLGTLRDAYDRLEKGGGITSTKNSSASNTAASISSSGMGQAVGKMLGTQNQSARNDIAMARPALLAALMKATGMSAKQMDSNAELKLWLSTATDPTLDVEANRRALDSIERKYLGATKAAPAAPAGWSIKRLP